MTRLSGKTLVQEILPGGISLTADFTKSEIDATIQAKGYNVIFSKNYLCPCKSKESDHRSTCKNCGGTGMFWANPTKTKMIISGIANSKKIEEWGRDDMGDVRVTAFDQDKLSKMDQVVIQDATSEISEMLYPQMSNDGSVLFSMTKYDIKSIDFIGLYVNETTKITKLVPITDYNFQDNIIRFSASYNALVDPCVTIRYVHAPTYYIWDVTRDAMKSTVMVAGVPTVITLPVHAIAKKAAHIKDAEKFDGTRLLDNSWLPNACVVPSQSDFFRQLQYTPTQTIYNNLTSTQKAEMLRYVWILGGGSWNDVGIWSDTQVWRDN